MKHTPLELFTLSLHPFPVALALSAYGVQVQRTLIALEANLISSDQDRVLLLLEKATMEDLSIIAIERLLRYTPCQHILLLVASKIQAHMIERWEYAASWEDGHPLIAQFAVTSMPQHAQEAQVCLATVFDIQVHIGVDSTLPFFKMFDVIVLYDIPTHPGHTWSQIVEIFSALGTCVIGLSSLLSEEEGEQLFERVIDAKGHLVIR